MTKIDKPKKSNKKKAHIILDTKKTTTKPNSENDMTLSDLIENLGVKYLKKKNEKTENSHN